MWERSIASMMQTPFKGTSFTVCGKRVPYMRQERRVLVDDLLEWLAVQPLFPKVYFEEEGRAIAGIGEAMQVGETPYFEGEGVPRFFGGRDFMARRGEGWESFPPCAYFLPLIEIEKRDEGTFLCLNRIEERIETSFEKGRPLEEGASWGGRFDVPNYSDWEEAVTHVVKGPLEKVVLARRTTWTGTGSPFTILRSLKGKSRFAFQFSEKEAFIGNSPETFYKREGREVRCHALAGTRPRGKTAEEEEQLAQQLLSCSKERREFRVVLEMIRDTLIPLCERVKNGDCTVLKAEKVQHLYAPVTGTLKDGISDQQLIAALHPTPAVGGLPRREALEEIEKWEPFDRGWYGAPVGYVSPSNSHHRVAIRSALVEKNALHLFAGTGLVAGSTPQREWEELEDKTMQYQEIL